VESSVSESFINLHLFSACNKCKCTLILIISELESHGTILNTSSLLTTTIRDDTTSLTPLFVGNLTVVVELTHVRIKIVVAVIDTLTRIEVDINQGDGTCNSVGLFIVSDLESLGDINLSTVRAGDGGHLLDTVM
jgi:hypothetical protein